MRRLLSITILLALVIAALTLASETNLKKLLPANNAISGWTGIAETYIYAPTGPSIVDIYDGDDQRYRTRGVVEAATKTYQKGENSTLQVFVHRTGAWQNAKSLYVHFRDRTPDSASEKKIEAKNDAYLYSMPGLTQAYGWRGKYFYSCKTYGNSAADRQAAEAFIKKIAREADKLVRQGL